MFLHAWDSSVEDIVVNTSLYAVLSVALFALFPFRRASSAVCILMMCVTLSLVVEAGQTLIPHRVSSAMDVVCNAVGAMFGLLISIVLERKSGVLAKAVTNMYRRHPWRLVGIFLSCGLMAYGLLPFDFVTSTAELHTSFQRLQLWDWPSGVSTLGELCGAGWFALVGFVIAKDVSERNDSAVNPVTSGILHGFILACLIEALQVFTRSHVPEITTVIIRCVACLGGALCVGFRPPNQQQTATPERPLVSTQMLFLAAALQAGVIFLENGRGGGSTPSHPLRAHASLPFQDLWLEPSGRAGAHTISILVSGVLLTLTLTTMLRRLRWAGLRPIAGVISVGVYFTAIVGKAVVRGVPVDLTDAILALLACGIALNIDRQLRSRFLAMQRV